MYLMDIVISAAFFHADAKLTVEHMFQNLFSVRSTFTFYWIFNYVKIFSGNNLTELH